MELLSSEYGWTPDQIRNLRVEDIEIYFKIINEKRLIENNLIKKHGHK